MAELIAKYPTEGILPFSAGTCRLTAHPPGQITSIMPYDGQKKPLSLALKAAHGMTFPAPNRATGKEGARLVWTSRGQAMLLGPTPDPTLAEYAALSDQSDGWSRMRLDGQDAEAVLARLCPVDLRRTTFKRGHTARTILQHLNISITRAGANTFDLMVFRSMTQTAVHEISVAMRSVAAQR